jgi:hypothetical protein
MTCDPVIGKNHHRAGYCDLDCTGSTYMDIKVGSAVTMTAVKREDGSLQVLRAAIGPSGGGPSTALAVVSKKWQDGSLQVLRAAIGPSGAGHPPL